MALNLDEKIVASLEALPVEGEISYDAYKALLQEQDPEGWKQTLQYTFQQGKFARRLDTSTKPATLLVSRLGV